MSDEVRIMAIAETASRTELARHSSLVTRHSSLHDWVTTVDHKKIGIMYVLMAVVFLVIGGVEALLCAGSCGCRAMT